MTLLSSILQYQFLQNAVLAGLLASIVCGLMGGIITEKKMVMMSGGIAHTAYGGIGLGYFLGFEPILGAFFVCALAALGMGFMHRKTQSNPDVLIGLFWSVGMALGILFIAFTPGYPPDITSYLFGNILAVGQSDILLMGTLTAIVTLTVAALFNQWKSYLFDEEFTSIRGINVVFLEYLLMVLIAMSVVSLIRVVGIILVLALFTAPPVIARMFTADLKKLMQVAVLLGAGFCFFGLWISYELNLASGASIVLLAGISYLLASAVCALFRKKTAS